MHRIFIFFILISFTSCSYFNVKKTSSEAILEEELQAFNWNEVDVYPSFETCDLLLDNAGKKKCFQTTITNTIYKTLSSEKIVVTQDIQDTVKVRFQISEKGELQLVDAEIDSVTMAEIPNLEILLHQGLIFLPKIYPAIKRGQQVKTQFTLPIRIEVN
ncbi:energy transducer TonB [Lacinutrix sp. C3R15]|nr:energy transducer TonB [Lacinutrix sp. C3R15]MBU2939082.1 energy transducer TonB [Lacinutrix sp. C3R15]